MRDEKALPHSTIPTDTPRIKGRVRKSLIDAKISIRLHISLWILANYAEQSSHFVVWEPDKTPP
jgi:hypothetical protein